MSAQAAEYCSQIHDHFKKFFAAFPPNDPLRLGDFGTLNEDIFTFHGNVTDRFGIVFGVRQGVGQASLIDFNSKGSVEVEFSAAAEAAIGTVPLKAGMEIKFSKENSIFFNAAQCTIDTIDDHVALGERILQLHEEGRWERKFAVITSLVKADSTTIAVSSSSNSVIKFEASTPGVREIDLADASLKLRIQRHKDVSLKIPALGGLTPLIGLSKVNGFFQDDFGPLSLGFDVTALRAATSDVRRSFAFTQIE